MLLKFSHLNGKKIDIICVFLSFIDLKSMAVSLLNLYSISLSLILRINIYTYNQSLLIFCLFYSIYCKWSESAKGQWWKILESIQFFYDFLLFLQLNKLYKTRWNRSSFSFSQIYIIYLTTASQTVSANWKKKREKERGE